MPNNSSPLEKLVDRIGKGPATAVAIVAGVGLAYAIVQLLSPERRRYWRPSCHDHSDASAAGEAPAKAESDAESIEPEGDDAAKSATQHVPGGDSIPEGLTVPRLRRSATVISTTPSLPRGSLSLSRARSAMPAGREDTLTPATTTPKNGEKPTRYVIVFSNPSSGGKTGERIVNTGVQQLNFVLPDPCVAIFCELNPEGLAKAVRTIHFVAHLKQHATCRVMVCGGDGSLAWVLQRLVKENLAESVPVGVLPLGTGNDMARVLGWGSSVPPNLLHSGMVGMRRWLADVNRAVPIWSDMWRVTISVNRRQGGSIVTIKKGKETELHSNKLELTMINYASIGQDAHVVYGTEQQRQNTPFKNRVMYVLQSAWRTLASQSLDKTLESASVDGGRVSLESLGSQASVAVLNISSYGGGANLWATATQCGESHPLSTAVCAPSVPQHQGDGVAELVAIRSLPQLGMHVGLSSGAIGGVVRAAQGRHFKFAFRKPSLSCKEPVTYVQVDGEGYKLVCATEIVIEKVARARLLALPAPVLETHSRPRSNSH